MQSYLRWLKKRYPSLTDIRIAQLHEEVLGELIRSFRQGGVGFYYRPSARGGWIHTDTGLQRTWKG